MNWVFSIGSACKRSRKTSGVVESPRRSMVSSAIGRDRVAWAKVSVTSWSCWISIPRAGPSEPCFPMRTLVEASYCGVMASEATATVNATSTTATIALAASLGPTGGWAFLADTVLLSLSAVTTRSESVVAHTLTNSLPPPSSSPSRESSLKSRRISAA